MITISNGIITAKINEVGAELKSVMFGGEERLFGGDPKFWANSAPIMFPFCGAFRNEQYRIGGKTYTMTGKHGFARKSLFEVEKAEADNAVFLLRDSDATLAQYPYSFEFRVRFALEGSTLAVTYEVTNTNDGTMYFSFGGHEAYYCPEGIEEYEILLPKKETLDSWTLEGPLLGYKKVRVITDSDRIPLKYEDFAVDALVFRSIEVKEATLRRKDGGREVKLNFEGFPNLLLWTKPGAPYICMEPWCGLADMTDADGDLTHKVSVQSVGAGEKFSRTHRIEYLK